MYYIKNVCLTVLAILLLTDVVWCKWCSRMVSEEHVHTITEVGKCQKSYQERCEWFSSRMCTFYEMVTCYKDLNQTVVQYRAVVECCPGYELDTADNASCKRLPDDSPLWDSTKYNEPKPEEVTLGNQFVPVVRLSVHANDSSQTRKSVHRTLVNRNNTVQYYKSDDDLLFGLSHGAYAGIICAFLFVSSVLSLILVHIIKKRQKAAVAKADASMETEMTEKIIQAPQA